MNTSELSYKLKYILKELGVNKKEFLELCQKFNPSLSKPTVLNAINGTNKILPSIETLSTFIKVCQTSDNEKIKNISYDFLLNDNIKEVEAKNAAVYQAIGLSDDVIDRLKQYNNPFYYDYGSIINYFFIHIPNKYWKYLEMLKTTVDIETQLLNISKNKDKQKALKEILRLFNDDIYLEYLERNFRNIYDQYLKLKNNKQINDVELKKLKDLLKILKDHFKYLLLEMNRRFYEEIF